AGVNCRAGASTAYRVIGVLREGDRVRYRGVAQHGWQPVLCDGRDGWIAAPYLRTNPTPTPTPAVPPTRTATTPPSATGTVSGT
ncbi:unnamed protein product, partial [Phaeothamnion confervicola]